MFLPTVLIFWLIVLGVGLYSRFLLSVISIFALLNGWRLLSSAYIVSRDVIPAPEMERTVVSIFPVDLILLLTLLFFLFSFLYFFSPWWFQRCRRALETHLSPQWEKALTLLFLSFSFFYILFIVITALTTAPLIEYPLFSGIHRRDFILRYGHGEMIGLFFKTLTYSASFFGIAQVFFIEKTSLNKWSFWLPSLSWLAMFSYLIVQGHRFSTLVWCLYFYYLPLSLLFISKKSKMADRLFLGLGSFFVISMVSMFIHSFVLGGFHATEKQSYLTQRILVDQAQLWNLSANRVFGFNNLDRYQAEGSILEPFFGDSIYNRSAQFLMFKEMGNKAYDSWEQSHLITMGFPESVMDLMGEEFIFPGILLLSIFLGFLFCQFFISLSSCKVIHSLAYLYLLNPLIYLFAGGTANAVYSQSYLLKCIIVIFTLSCIDWFLKSKWVGTSLHFMYKKS